MGDLTCAGIQFDPICGQTGFRKARRSTHKMVGGIDKVAPIAPAVESSKNTIRIRRVVRRIDATDRALAQAIASEEIPAACNLNSAERPEVLKDCASMVRVLLLIPSSPGEYQGQSSVLVGIRSKGLVQHAPVSMRVFAPFPCPQTITAYVGIQIVQCPLERSVNCFPISDPDRAQHGIGLAFRRRDVPCTMVNDSAIFLDESLSIGSPTFFQYPRRFLLFADRLRLAPLTAP